MRNATRHHTILAAHKQLTAAHSYCGGHRRHRPPIRTAAPPWPWLASRCRAATGLARATAGARSAREAADCRRRTTHSTRRRAWAPSSSTCPARFFKPSSRRARRASRPEERGHGAVSGQGEMTRGPPPAARHTSKFLGSAAIKASHSGVPKAGTSLDTTMAAIGGGGQVTGRSAVCARAERAHARVRDT